MRFESTPLAGAWIVQPKVFGDDRGAFSTVWDAEAFRNQGLTLPIRCNVSVNPAAGTLRGMHYQLPPCAEAKLVRCGRGRIYDVGIDLRPASPSFLGWFGIELRAEAFTSLYLPAGFAHGYLTLEADCEVVYMSDGPYRPELGRGLRWNDPRIGIDWPADVQILHPRDAAYADLNPENLPRSVDESMPPYGGAE